MVFFYEAIKGIFPPSPAVLSIVLFTDGEAVLVDDACGVVKH